MVRQRRLPRIVLGLAFAAVTAVAASGCLRGGGPPPTILALPTTPAVSEMEARAAGKALVDRHHLLALASPWSPTVARLAVVTTTPDELPGSGAILDPAAWAFTPLMASGVTLPAWSPDGARLAVVEETGAAAADEWPEGFSVRLLEASSGRSLAEVALPSAGLGLPFHSVRDALWFDQSRVLITSHEGTGLDALWLLDLTDGDLRRLTQMTLRFLPAGSSVAFEMWLKGGTRVGVVDAAGERRWFDPDRPQLLSDSRGGRVLVTAWPSTVTGGERPDLFSWDEGGSRRPRLLLGEAGWGSWSPGGDRVAALGFGSGDPASGLPVDLVVLDPSSRRVLLKVPLGRAPETGDGGAEDYWESSETWFESRRPLWSPSGDRLAFLDGAGNLWLLNVPAARLKCLWPAAAAVSADLVLLAWTFFRAEWSADGRYIATFVPVRGPGWEDYAVELTVLEVPGAGP